MSSTDTAPALIALGAKVKLVSAAGEREVAIADLYRNDGMDYLTRRPDEILTEVRLPAADGWKSAYWKLRRRGAFDFPVLGVAAAVRTAPDGTVEGARAYLVREGLVKLIAGRRVVSWAAVLDRLAADAVAPREPARVAPSLPTSEIPDRRRTLPKP